ncbi:DMP19 family protein [bacterium]|nr:DMP19 family protein [bacterium]
MGLAERLQDAFDRGVNDDGASLPPEVVPFYLAWKFILDWEMGMLAGYFYNTLPDLAAVQAQGEALETVGLTDMAKILRKGLDLFRDYKDPEQPSTWGDVLAQYDPEGILAALDDEIMALDNYGIDS